MDLVVHSLDFDRCTVVGKLYLLHSIPKVITFVMHEESFTFTKDILSIPSEGQWNLYVQRKIIESAAYESSYEFVI